MFSTDWLMVHGLGISLEWKAWESMASRLKPLGDGLAALVKGLGSIYRDTKIVVMSEFGRTVHENGNGGTDHGHGNVMWLLGGGIQGGKVYGEWPGLEEEQLNEKRDLKVTTDFREAIAPLITTHLNLADNALTQVFPSYRVTGNLGIV